MLKWVAQKVGISTQGLQLSELKEFVQTLQSADPAEIRAVAHSVEEYRRSFQGKGVTVGDPLPYVKMKPAIITRFEEFLESLQKNNDKVQVLAITVWLHTLRAANAVNTGSRGEEFKSLAQDMWRTLLHTVSGNPAMECPRGFEPGP